MLLKNTEGVIERIEEGWSSLTPVASNQVD